MSIVADEATGLGNYFIANYPPFSFWKPDYVDEAIDVLNQPAKPDTALGLYLHIPFCRKRCKFCYFRVYTDKNARDVDTYLNALAKEVELYSELPVVTGRPLQFIYFGGGTPSYLSSSQLRGLIDTLKRFFPWEGVEEITFECEPGTLQQSKLQTLKEIGITRLSLGIENFDDQILEANGRAHQSAEIFRAYEWAKELEFDQINIDLISGMVGETWDNWRDCIKKTIDISPDSVTIYQMELPFNTVFSKELKMVDQEDSASIADWPTKRAWVQYAFEQLGRAGYETSSGYTMVKDKSRANFVYRDGLWHGADLLGTGVASFGHVSGVHVQNVDSWEQYVETVNNGKLPLSRALPVEDKELLIREMILQLKTGRLEVPYFQKKFGTDIRKEFHQAFMDHSYNGHLTLENDEIKLTPDGLLQVDRLLPVFFLPERRDARYT